MKTITKTLLGTIAAGAVAIVSVSPGFAQGGPRDRDRDRDRERSRDRDGISTGEVIAGALVLGGIAAIAASSDNDRDYREGGRYGQGGSRNAIERCVDAAERQANRFSYGGRSNVTDIRKVDRTRAGYTVRGRIAVNSRGRDVRDNDPRYGRGWGNDYRGWDDNLRGYDAGNFTCQVRRGRVADVDFSGIRGLR